MITLILDLVQDYNRIELEHLDLHLHKLQVFFPSRLQTSTMLLCAHSPAGRCNIFPIWIHLSIATSSKTWLFKKSFPGIDHL